MKRMAIVSVLLAGSTALAQGPGSGRRGPGDGPRPGGPGFGPPIEMMAERLGLSEEQQSQIEALRAKSRAANKPLFEAARTAHQAFEQALEAEAPDATRVGQLALAMHGKQKQVEAARRADFEALKAVLTPEQVELLEQGWHGHGRHKHGRGMRDHGPEDGPGAQE